MEEVSWLLAVGKFLWLAAVYVAGLTVAVVTHELGHALAALAVTRQRVLLQVGRGAKQPGLVFGRLELRLNLRGGRYGFTRYERTEESRLRQTVVALAGPVTSLAGCVALAWLTTRSVVGAWDWILWLGLFVSHFRVLIVSLWPVAYRPDGEGGEVWLSDSLDVWRMWGRR